MGVCRSRAHRLFDTMVDAHFVRVEEDYSQTMVDQASGLRVRVRFTLFYIRMVHSSVLSNILPE